MVDLKKTALHYQNYLKLDKILHAQFPMSKELGDESHDEMLFIIIHQAYELWFKQIIHEIKSVKDTIKDEKIDEKEIIKVVKRTDRIKEILNLLVKQIDVLETMTSIDFLDFRDYLSPASGFQSHQFRKIEVMLGLKINQRHSFGNCPYHDQFSGEEKKEILTLEDQQSIFDLVEKWLNRNPFVNYEDFDFVEHYTTAIENMMSKEMNSIKSSDILTDNEKNIRIKMLEGSKEYYKEIVSKASFEEKNSNAFSKNALISALLIFQYKDQPILHMPYRFLKNLLDIDHIISNWRFRHAQMVDKMLGKKIGTGGSDGADYLKNTVYQNRIFNDISKISTLLLSRSFMPELPDKIKSKLGFSN